MKKRWSTGILTLLMSGALTLGGCARDTGRAESFAGLAGEDASADDEPKTQAIMGAWVTPDGYSDQDLIALANEHGGYNSVYAAAVNAGYIGDPMGTPEGDAEGATASSGDPSGGTGGGSDNQGGTGDPSGGGDSNDTPGSGGDNGGGTWGDGGGGTWGDGGGGTWGDGGGGTWGDDGGGWETSGAGAANEPDDGIAHREGQVVARMTSYAVTAGIVSQADTPAPGPADLIALGILAYGLYMTSGSGSDAPAQPCEACPEPDPPQVHEDHSHGNCEGAHWHYFRYNQNPQTCACYNQRMFGGCCGEGDANAPC